MAADIAIQQPAAAVVETPDGPVTLASVESLEQLVARDQGTAQELANQSAQAHARADALRTEAGSILTLRRADWASTDRAPRIDVARGVQDLISSLEQQINALEAEPHQGLGGFIHGLKDHHDVNSLKTKLQSARSELDIRFRAVVEQLDPPTGVAEADTLLAQIQSESAHSAELEKQRNDLLVSADAIAEEISRRKAAITNLGFDAPAVQADIIAHGLRAITANLVLKREEIAVVSVPATLCRYRTRTQYVGSSQGFSVPLGHGLRYRVSSYRGQPIQVEALTTIDQGNLVVTNQRLVFLGSKRDVSTPIAKLLQIEAFSNALAIGREGKESRDIFLVAHPAYVALFLQWIVSQQV